MSYYEWEEKDLIALIVAIIIIAGFIGLLIWGKICEKLSEKGKKD